MKQHVAAAWLGDPLGADNGLERCLHHVGVAAINVLEIARGKVDARGDPLRDELADLSGSGSGWGVGSGKDGLGF